MTHHQRLSSFALLFTWMSLSLPAQAQAAGEFFDDFSQCTSTVAAPLDRWTAVQAPAGRIRVNLYLQVNGTTCPNWQINNEAYLTSQHSGTEQPFPASPTPGVSTQAIWLNEAIPSSGTVGGSITRTASGLTVGRRYTVSTLAWTDDIDQPTALRLDFGSMSRVMPLQTNQNPQPLSATVCARSTTLQISLRQDGLSAASPIVTHVRLTDDNAPCQFTVSYDARGGTLVSDETVADNALATQPAPPTFAGQVFDGWYTSPTLTTRYDFATPVVDNITLYAKWVPGPGYTVSGTIVGLAAGQSVGLSNSGNGDATSGTGSAFAFTVGQASGAAYGVQISTQPPGQTCTVTQNGTGSIPNPGANVTNVVVECITLPVVNPPAKPVPAGTPWGLALLGSALAGWGLRRKRRHKTA